MHNHAMKLSSLATYLDQLLRIGDIADASANGVQVENSGQVTKIGLAVDACTDAIAAGAQQGCDLLLVHHGLLWGTEQRITDHIYQRVRRLIDADMALYAAHLPLDAHPELGHNRQIARALGISGGSAFAPYNGTAIGWRGELPAALTREEAAGLCTRVIGRCDGLLTYGSEQVRTIGIVSGSAVDPALFGEISDGRIDLLITGELKHWARYLAADYGIIVFFGGHYATETFGLHALGRQITQETQLATVFIDTP